MKFTTLALLLSAGCVSSRYPLPAQVAIAEPPAAVGEGRHEVSGSYAFAALEAYDPAHNASAKYRYGLVEGTELQVDQSILFFDDDFGDTDLAWLGSVGLKQEFGTQHISTSVRVGAGVGPAGTQLGGDLSLNVGYDNPYVVPYSNFRIAWSGRLSDETPDVAERALHYSATTGVRFKLNQSFFDIALIVGSGNIRGEALRTDDEYDSGTSQSAEVGHGVLQVSIGHTI